MSDVAKCSKCGYPVSRHPIDIDGPGAGQQVLCNVPTEFSDVATIDVDMERIRIKAFSVIGYLVAKGHSSLQFDDVVAALTVADSPIQQAIQEEWVRMLDE